MKKRHKELLSEIAFLIGDKYISDLRYQTNLNDIKQAVTTIKPEEYSLKQWLIAAQYIGSTTKHFNHSKEAQQFILNL